MINLLHIYYLDDSKKIKVVEKMANYNITVHFSKQEVLPEKVDVILSGAAELSSDILKAFPNLKLIQILGQATETIDLEYCKEKHIKVLISSEPRGHIIAEHTIGLLLSLTRNLFQADQSIRKAPNLSGNLIQKTSEVVGVDNWSRIESTTLYGKQVGIIGMGSIGFEILKRLQAFSCQVKYFKRTPFTKETDSKLNIQYLPFKTILETSDILIIQTPLTKSTRHLINSSNIHLLKKGVLLINCGRAEVVEETCLIEALSNKTIAAAGLDVHYYEPLPSNHKLCEFENVILTPHMAESGGNAPHLQREEAMESIINFFGNYSF